MAKIVHARLDPESEELLEELRRRTGWRDSEVVRRGLRALADLTPASRPRRVVGLGRFRSGIPDLGSDPRHLRGFGRS
jgi:hypothetical protein